MKKTILLSILTLTMCPTAFADRGGRDSNDGASLISCIDATNGVKILEFNSRLGLGQTSQPKYDLSVKTIGDEVGEMTIKDKVSQNFVQAHRFDELLEVTLVNGTDNSVQANARALTHRGFAQAQLVGAATGDQTKVESHSRRSVSRMSIQFATKAYINQPISITCEKIN
jgi:hypothetical protein